MTEKIYSIPDIQTILRPIFVSNGVRRAVLFGSYGKGSANKKSDVDLFVDSGLKGLKFVGLTEEVRKALDKEIDMFDISHIEPNSRIEAEIGETGVLLYEQ